MKKIIEGKMYNTETAKEIGEYDNGLSLSDFRHLSETLYRKKTGEFFLYATGGAMAIYAEKYCDGVTGGNAIIPLSDKAAQEWCEKHLDVETYVKWCEEVEE